VPVPPPAMLRPGVRQLPCHGPFEADPAVELLRRLLDK
jgi:hypothetical protein